MTTIVIADAHGYPWLIENALRHAAFDPAADRLVFAGDFLDRGPQPQACLDAVDRYATEVLVGNHELAVLLEDPITPFDADSALFEPAIRTRVLDAPADRAWRCAAVVDGVLITHAGVSARYAGVLNDECGGDLGAFATWLNRVFDESLRSSIAHRAVERDGLLGLGGPFWFRPRIEHPGEVLGGIAQIAGHTPARGDTGARFARQGMFLIDPDVYAPPERDRFRYAVIESGTVWIEDSTVGRIGPFEAESRPASPATPA